jgi:anti-sigma regulatory factor (Ser/Thr protein kinase)
VEPVQSIDLRILSNPANLPGVRERTRKTAVDVGFDEDDAEWIALAVDEALANVIKHGYGGRHDQTIEIQFDPLEQRDRPGLRITIRDFGQPVDPSQIRGRELDQVRPGGLGVHIINTVMDDVRYTPAEGGGTRLVMLKLRRHG